MSRYTILTALLLLPLTAQARAQDKDKDATALARQILDKGAALFDTRDAAALAATYTTDARIFWVDRESDSGQLRVAVKEGRQEVETLYRDLFKDRQDKTTSRNTVQFARFVASDLLLITGEFEPNIADEGKYTFVQERVKQGDKWLIKALRIYILPKD